MFEWIWETRPHVSELSGKPLFPKGHFQWAWQFMHVLSKGSHPSMKFDSDNILLGTPDEHSHQERYEVFKSKKIELKRKYADNNRIKKFT